MADPRNNASRSIIIDPDEFYFLNFSDTAERIRKIDPSDPNDALANKQLTTRKFFQDPKWLKNIHSFDISSDGVRGGVLFLYKKTTTNQCEAEPSFIIKLVDSPARLLFAEYALRALAGAKTPKSLAMEIEWDSSKSESMQLVRLIQKKQHSKVAGNKAKEDQYAKMKAKLASSKERPAYLVIMKILKGVRLMQPGDFIEWMHEWLNEQSTAWLQKWLTNKAELTTTSGIKKASFYSDIASLTPEARRITNTGIMRLMTIEEMKSGKWSPDSTLSFEKLKKSFNDHREVLYNADYMKQVGIVLAIDLLLGNVDRFEKGNFGNAFFMTSKKGVRCIGAIDNDAIFPILWQYKDDLITVHEQLEPKKKVDRDAGEYAWYTKFVLRDTRELGTSGTDNSDIVRIIENFDNWFEWDFCGKILDGIDYCKLLEQFYGDSDGKYLKTSSDSRVFPAISTDKNGDFWVNTVKPLVLSGFIEGLRRIQGLNFDRFRKKHAILEELYYSPEEINFHFKAFEVRHKYLCGVTIVAKSTSAWKKPDYNEFVKNVSPGILKATIIPSIQVAIKFGRVKNIITPEQASDILQYMQFIDMETQKNIVPYNADGSVRTKDWFRLCALLIIFDKYAKAATGSGGVVGAFVLATSLAHPLKGKHNKDAALKTIATESGVDIKNLQ